MFSQLRVSSWENRINLKVCFVQNKVGAGKHAKCHFSLMQPRTKAATKQVTEVLPSFGVSTTRKLTLKIALEVVVVVFVPRILWMRKEAAKPDTNKRCRTKRLRKCRKKLVPVSNDNYRFQECVRLGASGSVPAGCPHIPKMPMRHWRGCTVAFLLQLQETRIAQRGLCRRCVHES